MTKCKKECPKKVENKFKVDDYVYFKYNGVARILEDNEEPTALNAVWVWNTTKAFIGRRCFVHLISDSYGIEFYGPPTQIDLDDEGLKIDCVTDEFKKGDKYVSDIGGSILTSGDGIVDCPLNFSGLRYKLKEKEITESKEYPLNNPTEPTGYDEPRELREQIQCLRWELADVSYKCTAYIFALIVIMAIILVWTVLSTIQF